MSGPGDAPRRVVGLAVAGFICGLLGFLAIATSIPAMICGYLALHAIRVEGADVESGRLALAGMVMGVFFSAVLVVLAVLLTLFAGRTIMPFG